jgi:hypothetical protein
MTGELSSIRELLAGVILVAQVGCVGLVAAVVALRLAGRDRLLGALIAMLLVLVQAVGVSLLLGMVGLLRMPVVVAVHAVIAVVALRWHRHGGALDAQDGPDAAPAASRWGLAEIVAVGATSAYLAVGAYFSLTGGRSREFDTQEYHLSNLASWLRLGNIWHLPYAQPG